MEELNASMDAPAASWFSDLETEDYNFFSDECLLNLLDVDDEEFLSHDIACALQGNTLQHHSLSSESYSSSYPTSTPNTLSNTVTDETCFERPTKQSKTNSRSCNNSSTVTTEHFSPKLSPSSSPSSPSPYSPQILSFENSSSSPANNDTTLFYGFDCTLNPKQNEVVTVSVSQMGNMQFSAQKPNGSSKNQNFETKISQGTKRSPPQAQDHIMAERKRREKLSQSFIALAALLPGLKKMDKATVLGDAIRHVKELKARLALLEEESKKTRAESVVFLNSKPQPCGDDDPSSCDESLELDAAAASESAAPLQVEARVSEKEVLLRIHCQRQKGLLVRVLAEIQSLRLFVVNSSVLQFGDSILDITIIAQMGEGYNLTIKDLVKNLRVATLKSMSSRERDASMGVHPDTRPQR